MFNWIAEKVFGNFFHNLLVWSPWIWLVLCIAVLIYLFFALPLVFKKWWQMIVTVAVAGFVGLWFWQHFASYDKLKAENAALESRLEKAEQSVTNLQTSIDNQGQAIADMEARQRQIRRELAQARVGLDSTTIRREAADDPAKAAANLSGRWNNLGRMSDDETGRFGRAAPSAARPSADK